MFEYVLTLIIILLIVIIFVLVRKEHFSIKETYDDIKTTIKDKITSLTKLSTPTLAQKQRLLILKKFSSPVCTM